MSSYLKFFILFILSFSMSMTSVIAAEDIDELKQRLSSVERQMLMFKGMRDVSKEAEGASSSPTKSYQIQGDLTGDLASDFEIRISALQEDMQRLTGHFERNNHLVAQAREKLELLNTDLDFRLAEMEKRMMDVEKWQIQNRDKLAAFDDAIKNNEALERKINEKLSMTQASLTTAVPIQSDGVPQTLMPKAKPHSSSTSQNLDMTQGQATGSTEQPNPKIGLGAKESVAQESVNSSDLYESAFAHLRKPDYIAAEKDFSKFIAEFPDDPLLPNAQYWLAETHYARGHFDQAVSAFAEGYKRFPTHAKAMDNLVKMGLSFSALNKKEQACVTFAQFVKKFPKAPLSVSKRVKGEVERIGCAASTP